MIRKNVVNTISSVMLHLTVEQAEPEASEALADSTEQTSVIFSAIFSAIYLEAEAVAAVAPTMDR